MNVIVNGHPQELPVNATLDQLFSQLRLNAKLIVAEVNGVIIDRNVWDTHKLNDTDQIELVTFVGGG